MSTDPKFLVFKICPLYNLKIHMIFFITTILENGDEQYKSSHEMVHHVIVCFWHLNFFHYTAYLALSFLCVYITTSSLCVLTACIHAYTHKDKMHPSNSNLIMRKSNWRATPFKLIYTIWGAYTKHQVILSLFSGTTWIFNFTV